MASPRQIQLALFEKENFKLLNETHGLLYNDISNENVKRIECTPGGACVAVPFYSITDVNHSKPNKMVRIWNQTTPLQPSLEYRCEVVDSYLRGKSLPYFVNSHFYKEVLAVKGEILSGTIMDFVQGLDLIDYLAKCVQLPAYRRLLDDLAQKFRKMCQDLRNANISHGDLSGTNIRVLDNGDIRLIDYDSICIPQRVGKVYSTDGTDAYNHRQRKGVTMQLNTDYFPEMVIYATIIILRENPQLWSKYVQESGMNDGGMLFTSTMLKDVSSFKNSNLYSDIIYLAKRNNEISQTLDILLQSIKGAINDVPFLFDKLSVVKIVNMASYCGSCGHHFDNQTDIYCPMCGAKRETI